MLGTGDRLGPGQPGQGLVAIPWQQQALQIVTQAAALGQAREQGVEALGVVLKWTGRGRARTAGAHRRSLAPGGGQTMNRTAEAYPKLNKLPIRPPWPGAATRDENRVARPSSAFLGAREPVDKTDAGAFPAPRTVAVSTRFSVVSSVGPAGHHPRAMGRCRRWSCWSRAAPGWMSPRTRWWPACAPPMGVVAEPRRCGRSRPSPQGGRRWLGRWPARASPGW